MDSNSSGTVGGSDSPGGSLAPLSPPPSETLSVPVASMEALNNAMHGTSISAKVPRLQKMKRAGPKKKKTEKMKKALDSYEAHFALAERISLIARKRIIHQLRTGNLDPTFSKVHYPPERLRPRREEAPDHKLYPLFQCVQGHSSCMRCYERHSKCRYCLTAEGSVNNLEKEDAEEYTNLYSCHKGRGWLLPKEDDFFCPDTSCQFCGPLDSVLKHVTDAHSSNIHHFSYGEVIRIPFHLIDNYLILSAEDRTTFVLSVVNVRPGKVLSVVCAEQPSSSSRKSRFTLDFTYDVSPVLRTWLRGEAWAALYYSTKPRVKPWDDIRSSIVKYEKNHDVAGIAHAQSEITSSHISSSNLGDMYADTKQYSLYVSQRYCHSGKWYGDLILSISSLPDATKSPANV